MVTLSNFEAQVIIDQKEELDTLCSFSGKSKSQFKQDIFVLSQTGFKRNGFFVEFGGLDGVLGSNTYLLEKEFGWNGIIAEPLKSMHDEIQKNRTCNIEFNCIWSESKKILNFNETDQPALSTIEQFNNSDLHSVNRQKFKKYTVETISLLDMLEKHKAPYYIDYLSIDTEGSEFEILNTFDFSKRKIKIITCEHNFSHNRDKINSLLTNFGYKRFFPNLSQFDDWYVNVTF